MGEGNTSSLKTDSLSIQILVRLQEWWISRRTNLIWDIFRTYGGFLINYTWNIYRIDYMLGAKARIKKCQRICNTYDIVSVQCTLQINSKQTKTLKVCLEIQVHISYFTVQSRNYNGNRKIIQIQF